MKFFKHNHDIPETEELEEDADGEYLHNALELNEVLENLKIEHKEEYLEAWRKDYLERLNKIIDWALSNPKYYSDVITILFKFEEFYTQMRMLIGQAEAMKRAYRDIQHRTNIIKERSPEIG